MIYAGATNRNKLRRYGVEQRHSNVHHCQLAGSIGVLTDMEMDVWHEPFADQLEVSDGSGIERRRLPVRGCGA